MIFDEHLSDFRKTSQKVENIWMSPLSEIYFKFALTPHGLTFGEDEATVCPMPLEALPTPFDERVGGMGEASKMRRGRALPDVNGVPDHCA